MFKTFKQMRIDLFEDEDSSYDKASLEYYDNDDATNVETQGVRFARTHPGQQFSYLRQRKFEVILIIYISKGSMCRIQDLDLGNQTPPTRVNEMRESYTNFALLMFHPYRKKEDIMTNGSYWEKFNNE